MYLSERDGDYYRCACGKTLKHSYLLSESNGFLDKCCVDNGWKKFKYKGVVLTKKPEESVENVKYKTDLYHWWLGKGMPGYSKDKTCWDYEDEYIKAMERQE